jgi:hypothetical protein
MAGSEAAAAPVAKSTLVANREKKECSMLGKTAAVSAREVHRGVATQVVYLKGKL